MFNRLAMFQSTLPVRAATSVFGSRVPEVSFNPRCPCGQRRGRTNHQQLQVKFQSTLPVRAATRPQAPEATLLSFQSTLPVRAATLVALGKRGADSVSIHAARAGSDTCGWPKGTR